MQLVMQHITILGGGRLTFRKIIVSGYALQASLELKNKGDAT